MNDAQPKSELLDGVTKRWKAVRTAWKACNRSI